MPLGKRKWLIFIAVALLAVVLTLASYQVFVSSHMYPQDALHADSNLSLKGGVTSIEESHRVDGMNGYQLFRLYFLVNITEIVWVDVNLADLDPASYVNGSLRSGKIIGVGYDNLDKPELLVGQTVECKGHYVPMTDSPYSYHLNIAPTISESYLKLQE